MTRISLKGMSEEEKRQRLLKQKAAAQKRYYEKHKNYYIEQSNESSRRLRKNMRETIMLIKSMQIENNLSEETYKILTDILNKLTEK